MTNLPIDPTLVTIGRRFEKISEGVPEHLLGFAVEQVAQEFGWSVSELLIELETRMALGWLFGRNEVVENDEEG